MSELRYPFFQLCFHGNQTQFHNIKFDSLRIFFEGNTAKIISYQAKKTVCLYLY